MRPLELQETAVDEVGFPNSPCLFPIILDMKCSFLTRESQYFPYFSMATEDRYVICQDAAKEMLSVAICDHYNRAKENTPVLLGAGR